MESEFCDWKVSEAMCSVDAAMLLRLCLEMAV